MEETTTSKTKTRLSDIDLLDQVEHEVYHPRDPEQKLGAVIVLAGPEHPRRKALQVAQQRAARKRMARGNPKTAWQRLIDTDVEEEEAEVTEFLVACTLGWRNLEWKDGPLPFTAENARLVYTDPKRAWLRRQLLEALNDQEGFIGSSANA